MAHHDHISFCIEDALEGPRHRPTVTVYGDGTYKEHSDFAKAKKVTIALYRSRRDPTRKQLDLAERFAV